MAVSDRLQAAILAALDKPFRVRIDSRTVIVGVVTNVVFEGWRKRDTTKIAQFRVWMECGTAKAIQEFVVEKLPNDRANSRTEVEAVGYHVLED